MKYPFCQIIKVLVVNGLYLYTIIVYIYFFVFVAPFG